MLTRKKPWATVVIGLLLTGCLRFISKPDDWPCESDDDCESSEKCTLKDNSPISSFLDGDRICRPEDWCATPFDCGEGLFACNNSTCFELECTVTESGSCGLFSCVDNSCLTSCVDSSDCKSEAACKAGSCVDKECDPDLQASCDGYACSDGICLQSCSALTACASGFDCVDGRCLTQSGACTVDGDCASGACCPGANIGEFSCASSSCDLRIVGDECSWNAQCAAGSCVEGKCADCDSEVCRSAICADVACGTVLGVGCGTCGELELCNGGVCEAPCAGAECGVFDGVNCGSCDEQEYCAEGKCSDACGEAECGTKNGVHCGDCAVDEYCNAGSCADACGDALCGTVFGVHCGSCPTRNYCNDGACEDACGSAECGSLHGVSCGSCDGDDVCVENYCEPKVCENDQEYFCLGGNVHQCDERVSSTLIDTCSDTEYCEDGRESCEPYCTEGETDCKDGWFGTCAAGGTSLESGARDCFDESLSCSSIAGCGVSRGESFGNLLTDKCGTHRFVGNILYFSSDTTVSRFGILGKHSEQVSADYLIYESSSASGPFNLIYSNTSIGFSGETISVISTDYTPVSAGKYYMLAVHSSDDSAALCYTTPSTTSKDSFTGGYHTGTGIVLDSAPTTITASPVNLLSSMAMYTYSTR